MSNITKCCLPCLPLDATKIQALFLIQWSKSILIWLRRFNQLWLSYKGDCCSIINPIVRAACIDSLFWRVSPQRILTQEAPCVYVCRSFKVCVCVEVSKVWLNYGRMYFLQNRVTITLTTNPLLIETKEIYNRESIAAFTIIKYSKCLSSPFHSMQYKPFSSCKDIS